MYFAQSEDVGGVRGRVLAATAGQTEPGPDCTSARVWASLGRQAA